MSGPDYGATLDRVGQDALAHAGCRVSYADIAASMVVTMLTEHERLTLAEAIAETKRQQPALFYLGGSK